MENFQPLLRQQQCFGSIRPERMCVWHMAHASVTPDDRSACVYGWRVCRMSWNSRQLGDFFLLLWCLHIVNCAHLSLKYLATIFNWNTFLIKIKWIRCSRNIWIVVHYTTHPVYTYSSGIFVRTIPFYSRYVEINLLSDIYFFGFPYFWVEYFLCVCLVDEIV